MKTLLIADDHPVFRNGLVHMIKLNEGYEVIAEAEDGKQALDRIEEMKPDIAILDMVMPELSGIDVAMKIKKKKLNTKCLILTAYEDSDLFKRSLKAGVKGYLLKEDSMKDIMIALQFVVEDKLFISPKMSPETFTRNKKSITVEKLTKMEKAILKLIAEKKTSKVIAKELNISYRTVGSHRLHICSKFDLHGTNALSIFALENKPLLK